MARKGLGKGLDSLIPDFYNEDFDSNSPQSLEDILNQNDDTPEDDDVESIVENEVQEEEKNSDEKAEESVEETVEEVEEENEETPDEEVIDDDSETETDIEEEVEEDDEEEVEEESSDFDYNPKHVEEVKAIVDKNPRITLWSSRSSAVFRYLRKTEPEFSISKEASILIDEAVSKKYPEIWKLFEE